MIAPIDNAAAGSQRSLYVTQGGWYGYVLRRFIHIVIMPLVPWLYFHCVTLGKSTAESNVSLEYFAWLFVLLIVFEGIRLYRGVLFWGMRAHERTVVSSLAWGFFSLVLTLLLAPTAPSALGIIWCVCWVDPLMGELRRLRVKPMVVFVVGLFAACLLWSMMAIYYDLSLCLAIGLAGLAIFSEWPCLSWIDDNALMMLVPLIAACLWYLL